MCSSQKCAMIVTGLVMYNSAKVSLKEQVIRTIIAIIDALGEHEQCYCTQDTWKPLILSTHTHTEKCILHIIECMLFVLSIRKFMYVQICHEFIVSNFFQIYSEPW